MKKSSAKKPKKAGAGRPTKYKPQYCKEIVSFFDVEAYKIEAMETMTEYFKDGVVKKVLERKKIIPEKLPTFYRFAEKIGVDQGVLNDWTLRHKKFHRAFTRAKELQKEFLITLGLSGASPPAAFMFVAANITDMRSRGIMTDDLPPGMLIPVIIRKGDPRALPEPEAGRRVHVDIIQSANAEK